MIPLRLDTESLLIVRPNFLRLAKLLLDLLCDFSWGLLPASNGLVVAPSTSVGASAGGCSSFIGEDGMRISAAPACPPPPTSLIVVLAITSSLEVSGSNGGCVTSGVKGDGSISSFSIPGIESANKSGTTEKLDGKMVEVAGEVVGEINGGGVDEIGMAEPMASDLSR